MMGIFEEKLSPKFLGINGNDRIMTSSPRDIYTWDEFHLSLCNPYRSIVTLKQVSAGIYFGQS